MSGWTVQEVVHYLELRGNAKQCFEGVRLVTDFTWPRGIMTSKFGKTQIASNSIEVTCGCCLPRQASSVKAVEKLQS